MQMTFTGERYVPQLRGQIYYEHLHRYALALSLAADKDVLDIASGEGYGSALLAMVARSVVGVDIDESSVMYAGSRYTAMNLSFRAGSATQIPIADASVDLVVSFETIEHLVEHERMFAEFKRVLRPAGRLIISSPNKLIYSDARAYTNPYHVRELYFHELRDTLKDFFPAVRLFGHRIFAGSAVHPLNEISQATKWLGPSAKPENGISSLPDPEYFIAICSTEAKGELPDLSSVYLDPRDNLLDDVRSGGLTAGDAAPSVLETGPLAQLSTAPLSLAQADAHLQKEPTPDQSANFDKDRDVLTERIYSLEQMRSDEHDRAESLAREIVRIRQQIATQNAAVQQERAKFSELEDSFLATLQSYEDESRLRKELQITVDRHTEHDRTDELEDHLLKESARAESLAGELERTRQQNTEHHAVALQERTKVAELEDSFLATLQNYEDESRLRKELQITVDRLTKHDRTDELEDRLLKEGARAESLAGELEGMRQQNTEQHAVALQERTKVLELEDSFFATLQNYEDESRLRKELQITVDRLTKSEEQSKAEVRKVQRREGELRLTLENARDEISEVRRACRERDVEAHVSRAKLAEDAAFIDEVARRSIALRDENLRLIAQVAHARANAATTDSLRAEIELVAIDHQRVLGLLREALERSASLQQVSDALLSSKSWTMTRPIRRAAAALSRR